MLRHNVVGEGQDSNMDKKIFLQNFKCGYHVKKENSMLDLRQN